MKKIVLAVLIALSPMIAKDEVKVENPFLHEDHFPGGYFLMSDSLPHFMGMYMKRGGMHKVKPTKEQEEVLEKQFAKMVKIIMKTATEIKGLETMLTLKVVDEGKTAKDMSEVLDQITQKRKDLTILQIECLNVFKNILNKEQYKMIKELAISESKKR